MIKRLFTRVFGGKAGKHPAGRSRVIPFSRHHVSRDGISYAARRVTDGLQAAGYSAFVVGGAVRERVRMYTHLGGGSMKAVYESFDPGPVIDLAREVVSRGYTAVKVVCVPYSEPLMNLTYVKKFAAVIGKLRDAVGDSVDIMIDFHGRTTPAMAVEDINAVAEFSPFFCV